MQGIIAHAAVAGCKEVNRPLQPYDFFIGEAVIGLNRDGFSALPFAGCV